MSACLVALVAVSSLFVTADNRIGSERGQLSYEDDVIHRQVGQRQECFIPQCACEAAHICPCPNNA